jgi:hypothetical protein
MVSMRSKPTSAIHQRPHTSKPAVAREVCPYLLGGLAIERVNQVWGSDVTYIPMARGFLFHAAALAAGGSDERVPGFCRSASTCTSIRRQRRFHRRDSQAQAKDLA